MRKKYGDNVIGFDETITIRIISEEKEKIKKILKKNRDLYFNESHFVRCSIIKLLREYDNNGRRIN